VLVLFSFWAVLALRSATPFRLFTVLANVAGLVLAIGAVQVFLVNRRFLPRAVRPPLWREAALWVCAAFYAFFSYFAITALIRALVG
jgi:hypothetical protein